jgi:hypothetical protein
MARTRRPKLPHGPLRPFDVQLVGATVHEIRTSRRRRKRTDSDKPIIESWLQPHLHAGPEEGLFTVLAGADVTHVAGPRQMATVHCSVMGFFSYRGAVSDEMLTRFQHVESMVLLWPYLRAAVAELARMMDTDLPPLPTLDVLKELQRDSGDEQGPRGNQPSDRPRRNRLPSPDAATTSSPNSDQLDRAATAAG